MVHSGVWNIIFRMDKGLLALDDLTPEGIHHLPLEKLQDLIRPSGFYKQKSQYLKVLTERFMSYDCHVKRIQNLPLSDVLKELLGVHGVGNETADSILLYAFHFPPFVVDAYPCGFSNVIHLMRERPMFK